MGAEIIAICIGTFSWLEKDMNEKSANTMSEVGEIYMSGMSADAFADDIQHCIDAGMNAHTSKPIDIDKISGLL